MARKTGSHSEITGPRIQAAALKLFARHGFAAVSMRQIASDVGVQAGAIYNYTDDKQTLLYDLLKGHMDATLAALPGPGTDAMADLEAFVRFHIAWHLARPEALFISYMELRNLTEVNFADIETLRGTYEARVVDILDRGARAGVMQVRDTKLTVRAVIALLNGIVNWYREDGEMTVDSVADAYWAMVRRMVVEEPTPEATGS